MGNVKELVCDRCWRDIFDTEEFQTICAPDYKPHYVIEWTTTCRQVRESAHSGCNWCRNLHRWTGRICEADPDTVLYIKLSRCVVDSNELRKTCAFDLNVNLEKAVRSFSDCTEFHVKLHAFADPDDIAAAVVPNGPLRTDVNSDSAHQQMKEWLVNCSEHSNCSVPPEAVLPTRIIDLRGDDSKEPRLRITNGEQGRYAVLSYCWGTGHREYLHQFNIDEYTSCLPMKLMPPTFREAIEVAKRIGIPFIWIDALCIVQDSESDKRREISMMSQTYRNSFVCIVAANSGGVQEGFSRRFKQPPDSYTIPFKMEEGGYGRVSVQELGAIEYHERSEPINQRAWTLQEQLMPCRYLVFASHTLQWRCNEGVVNLGNSMHYTLFPERDAFSESLTTLKIPALSQMGELRRWLRIVQDYSRRTSTFPRDKLTAIAGIAQEFARSLGPCYYAGLWQTSLLLQLLWWTKTSKWLPTRRANIYRAPSWSWASIDTGVDFNSRVLAESESKHFDSYRCNIVNCSVTPRSYEIPFGEVVSGKLTLNAVVRQAWLKPSTNNIFWLDSEDPGFDAAEKRYLDLFRRKYPNYANMTSLPDGTDELMIYGSHDERADCLPISVYCLPITERLDKSEIEMGLLLVTTENGMFTRIGSFSDAPTADFTGFEQREITLV